MPQGRLRTKFVVDAMLGSLARKLRAFGFDALYYKDGNDPELLAIATRERRVLLTSDRALAASADARGVPSLVIAGKTESARMASLRNGADARGISLTRGPPRCSVCNGDLEALGRTDVTGRIPPGIIRRHRRFYRCSVCGRYYWRGSHWKKLRWLERRLRQTSNAGNSRRG